MKIKKVLPCIGICLSLCACGINPSIPVSPGKTSEDVIAEQTEEGGPHAPDGAEKPAPQEAEPGPAETQATKKITGYESWQSSEDVDALIRALSLEETVTEGTVEGNSYYDGLITSDAYYLDEVKDILGYQFDEPLQIVRYAFLDMDYDGQPEALLEMANGGNAWYKVLHYDDGTVYSFSFVCRGFENPKADGVYIGSNGAADNYYFRLTFDGAKAKEIETAHSESDSSGEEFMIRYYLGGKEVTEEDFLKYSAEQENKDGVSWQDYSTGEEIPGQG